MNKENKIYSKIVLLFCFAVMAYGNLVFYPRWELPGTQSNIAWDVEGYYWYLPSVFIFNDLKKQGFKDEILQKYQASGMKEFQHGFIHEKSGNYVMKYSSGMAFLYSPAFFTGHAFAKILKYPQDGFSPPYKLALQIWGLLFSFLGLIYLRKLFKIFYSDELVALMLFLLVVGSNYLNYASIDIGMSHTWLFTIYVFIILNTHYFYTRQQSKYLIRVSFLVGLTVLIRPTEVISALIPALWGLENIKSIKERIQFIFQKKGLYLLAALCAFSIISIQLFYWKYVSGDWLVYSYQDQGFNFIRPHAFVYSWSYKSGWLRYSPMMLLCFAGLFVYWKHGRNKVAVITFFVLNYYIVSAWNIWDYGGFGGRAMIQSYPILLFPMTTLLELAFKKRWSQMAIVPVLLLFTYMNIWFTYQAHRGNLLDSSCETSAYYWKTVGRWTAPREYEKLKETDELFEGIPKSKTIIYTNPLSDKNEYCVSKQNNAADVPTVDAKLATKKWLRAEADFHCVEKEWDVWQIPQLSVKFFNDGKETKVRFIRIGRLLEEGETKRLYLDIKVPEEASDSIKVSLYNVESQKEMCMSNLEISTFDE